MYNRFRSCVTERDFTVFSDARHTPTAPDKISSTGDLPSNTWTYNSTLQAAHVNDTESNKKGGFTIPLGYLKRGDIVKVSGEFRSISGAKPRLGIDRSPSDITGLPDESLKILVSDKQTEFEQLEMEVIADKDGYHSVFAGTTTAEIGEFYVKNIQVKIDTVLADERPYRKTFKAVSIRTTGTGIFETWSSHANDPCTLTIENDRLKVTFIEPFTGFSNNINRPIALIGQQGNVSQNYDIRIIADGSTTGQIVFVQFYNRGTTTLVNPSTIPNWVFFNIIVVGLDILSNYL